MKTNEKMFMWLMISSLLTVFFSFRHMPPTVLTIVGPTVALLRLISLAEIVNKVPSTHWIFKIRGLGYACNALKKGMTISTANRISVLAICFFIAWIAVQVS